MGKPVSPVVIRRISVRVGCVGREQARDPVAVKRPASYLLLAGRFLFRPRSGEIPTTLSNIPQSPVR